MFYLNDALEVWFLGRVDCLLKFRKTENGLRCLSQYGGERCRSVFGPSWMHLAFIGEGRGNSSDMVG